MYNILVCDDEPDIRRALKIYLSGEGWAVLEAENGREMLDLLEKGDVQLVLMDIMMPRLDGMAATAKLREKSNVPVILLTAKSSTTRANPSRWTGGGLPDTDGIRLPGAAQYPGG